MDTPKMDDRYLLDDALSSEKSISCLYNTFASECSNINIKNTFLDILRENQNLQTDIFNEMSARGWYSVTKAEDTKISQAKTKFQNKIES